MPNIIGAPIHTDTAGRLLAINLSIKILEEISLRFASQDPQSFTSISCAITDVNYFTLFFPLASFACPLVKGWGTRLEMGFQTECGSSHGMGYQAQVGLQTNDGGVSDTDGGVPDR